MMESKASAFFAAISPMPQLQFSNVATSTMFLRVNSQLHCF